VRRYRDNAQIVKGGQNRPTDFVSPQNRENERKTPAVRRSGASGVPEDEPRGSAEVRDDKADSEAFVPLLFQYASRLRIMLLAADTRASRHGAVRWITKVPYCRPLAPPRSSPN